MIFGFSDFPIFRISVFQILEIGVGFSDFGDWRNYWKIWKTKFELEMPLSEAKLSCGTPKGVINARKKTHSTKTNVFSTFSGFSDFSIFRFLDFLSF